jgi:MFS family permease
LMGFAVLIIKLFMFLVGGFAADYHGRKKLIVLTAFYGVVFPLLYAVFQDWQLFVLISVIAAFGSLSVPATQVIIADSASPEKRARGISVTQVVSSVPLVVTPLVWGWLISTLGWLEGFKIGCIYSVATALVSAVILLFFLKETIKPKTAEPTGKQRFSLRLSFSEAKRYMSRSLTALMAAFCLIAFANAAVGNYYIIYATEVIGLPALEWSLILSFQILSALALKIPGAWIADRFGKKKVLAFSAFACAPLTVVFTFSGSFIAVFMVMILLIVAGIYYDPVHQALQADLTPRQNNHALQHRKRRCSRHRRLCRRLAILCGDSCYTVLRVHNRRVDGCCSANCCREGTQGKRSLTLINQQYSKYLEGVKGL